MVGTRLVGGPVGAGSSAAAGVTAAAPDGFDQAQASESPLVLVRARGIEPVPRPAGVHVRVVGGILAATLSLALIPIGGNAMPWLSSMGIAGAPIAFVLGALLGPRVLRGDRFDAWLLGMGFGLAAAATGAVVVAVAAAFGPSNGFGGDGPRALTFYLFFGLLLSPIATVITVPLAWCWAAAMRVAFLRRRG